MLYFVPLRDIISVDSCRSCVRDELNECTWTAMSSLLKLLNRNDDRSRWQQSLNSIEKHSLYDLKIRLTFHFITFGMFSQRGYKQNFSFSIALSLRWICARRSARYSFQDFEIRKWNALASNWTATHMSDTETNTRALFPTDEKYSKKKIHFVSAIVVRYIFWIFCLLLTLSNFTDH